jgi:hypothetical protein
MQDNVTHVVIKTLPPSKERLPLFVVGDVHGCAKELSHLISTAKRHMSQFQLVLLGDLFTKGPDPVGVYDLIQEHNAICIKGNHDWALWSIIYHAQKRHFHTLGEHTKQTLHLIRYHKRSIFDFLCTLPHAYTTTITPHTQQQNWEEEYPMIIVHAGIDPTKGLLGTTERMLLTARYVRWDLRGEDKRLIPVQSAYRSEVLNPAVSNPDSLLLPSGEVQRFRWHGLHEGPELVLFGHDAKQGLFRKTLSSGRPICVGVDTGCTYGNSLTGYFPEMDQAIQVRAQRKYFDIKKNIILLKTHS